ncbi:MAG: hypothetical protein M1833_003584 [Piccolia ochrophora]|nr:MAG: hypothetical protein M1833_003584 [Piccolia ochrophora]
MPEHSHSHNHDHDHDHNHADHDHSHDDDLTPAHQTYLYSQIAFDDIRTLNEVVPDSGAAVVKKGWAERMSVTPELVSDADQELLMFVPFTGQVKLHSILFRSPPTSSAPRTVHLFLNRDDLDFSSAASLVATQTLEVPQTSEVVEMPLKRALWNATQNVTLFFEDNHGAFGAGGEEAEVTRVSFLGFKGEWMRLSREPVSFLYESAARPQDHKVKGTVKRGVGSGVGGPGGGMAGRGGWDGM